MRYLFFCHKLNYLPRYLIDLKYLNGLKIKFYLKSGNNVEI
jgi:hypothetical protein